MKVTYVVRKRSSLNSSFLCASSRDEKSSCTYLCSTSPMKVTYVVRKRSSLNSSFLCASSCDEKSSCTYLCNTSPMKVTRHFSPKKMLDYTYVVRKRSSHFFVHPHAMRSSYVFTYDSLRSTSMDEDPDSCDLHVH